MKLKLKIFPKLNNKVLFGILYLFQISAIIGISLGFKNWFISKTPLLLFLNILFLGVCYPLKIKDLGVLLFLFLAGMTVEWIGVHYDFLFGAYYYGANLGVKFQGVPWFIGCNWMVLVVVTSAMARQIFSKKWLIAFFGAFLMVFLDFFIEPVAPRFDFWIWKYGHAPLRNFIAWFFVAAILQYVFITYSKNRSSGIGISLHIYVSQLLFFMYFYFFYNV